MKGIINVEGINYKYKTLYYTDSGFTYSRVLEVKYKPHGALFYKSATVAEYTSIDQIVGTNTEENFDEILNLDESVLLELIGQAIYYDVLDRKTKKKNKNEYETRDKELNKKFNKM